MIKVEGQNILPEELEKKRKKAENMERKGYSTDQILYIMSKENSVSGIIKDGNFVITIL